MKFWVLVGLGPDDVQVPCLIFETKFKAMARCIELLGDPVISPDAIHWDAPDFESHLDEENERILAKPFFTSYYGGCGECWAFELMETTEGKPFVGFDLE